MINNNDIVVGTTVDAFGEDLKLTFGKQSSMNNEHIAF
jgi:hypothetical protein